ncbi:hypothetical protein [Alkalimonas amylolytica]|uniref:hypothetical protein n=1 Tax=Alkalimonas amylolytica TaxID=152573 RepID=UPI000B8A2601|nr:hypothetical protein [Alkalimonas amylolytica]
MKKPLTLRYRYVCFSDRRYCNQHLPSAASQAIRIAGLDSTTAAPPQMSLYLLELADIAEKFSESFYRTLHVSFFRFQRKGVTPG